MLRRGLLFSAILLSICVRGEEKPGDPAGTLAEARKGFQTRLLRKEHDTEAVAEPPANLFHVVQYESTAGKLAAYLSVAPKDRAKHPAIIWIFGGFDNGIGDTAWKDAPAATTSPPAPSAKQAWS